MNLLAFGAVAAMPLLIMLALNFEAIHGYYAYSLPVAGSTVELYMPYYMMALRDDFDYDVHLVPSVGLDVRHWPMSERATVGSFTIRNITMIDSGTIKVDFADNDYTITRSSTGRSYKPVHEFSHSETIGVNQTFVVMCNNPPASWLREGEADNSTGLAIFQYRGLESHNVTEVRRFLPAADRAPDGTPLAAHGDTRYEESRAELDPPRELLTHKFLFMSGSTNGRIECDFPQIIEHTIDSKGIGPDQIKAVSGALYEWYRQRPGWRGACCPRQARGRCPQAGDAFSVGCACRDDGMAAAGATWKGAAQAPRPPSIVRGAPECDARHSTLCRGRPRCCQPR